MSTNNRKLKSSPEEVRSALNSQKEDGNWNFYLERELLENTLNQRVNFVIAVFALFVTAAATVDSKTNLLVVFATSTFLLAVLTLTTWRVYTRLNVVLIILYDLEGNQVLPFVKKEIDHQVTQKSKPLIRWIYKWLSKPMIWYIYVGVPLFCTISMSLGLILTCCGCIEPSGSDPTINNFNSFNNSNELNHN